MPCCPVRTCNAVLPSVHALKLHLRIFHLHVTFLSYQCNEQSCFRDFKNWQVFKRHLIQYHKCITHTVSNSVNVDNVSRTQACNVEAGHMGVEIDDVEILANEVQPLTPEDIGNMLRSSLLCFVSKLYAAPNLSRNHVQVIVEDTKEFIDEMLSLVKTSIIDAFNDKNCNNSFVNHIEKLSHAVQLPFESLSTEYRRLKAFSDSGALIYPEMYAMGDVLSHKKKDGRIVRQMVPVTAHFVPLRKTLKIFFSFPNVFERVMEYVSKLEREQVVLSNFIQGDYWQAKKHRLYEDKIVLPLFIYYDDFEVNNPLGSHKIVQKIGGTYAWIPCLPPEFQSLLENVFVALLCHASDRKNYTNSNVFRILVNEINYLQEHGIEVESKSGKKTVFFALGGVLGDNLGLNEILGYTGGFTAHYFCRWCKTIKKDTYTDCFERKGNLRCIAEYQDDVNVGMQKSGISEASIWNEVNGFHVYDNCIADLMHDGPGGAFKYDMGHITHHFILKAEKKICLDHLNERLMHFDYLKHGFSNRPPTLLMQEVTEKNLKMSASEMMCYIYAFPFLVGDIVSHDEVWNFYLCLRNIVNIVVAPAVHRDCADLLNVLVSEHHEMYVRLFKDTLKPKHHFMVHWGRVLKASGPLIGLSAYKFESKNRKMKVRAHATYSRKLTTYTVCLKEQLEFAYRAVCKRGFEQRLEIGPSCLLEDMTDMKDTCELSTVQVPSDDFRAACVETNWVTFKGSHYRVGMCVVVGFDDTYSLPIFGEIDRILCNEKSNVCFLYHELQTVCYEENLHVYKLESTGLSKCTLIEDLLSYMPAICVRMADGNLYVALRHAI